MKFITNIFAVLIGCAIGVQGALAASEKQGASDASVALFKQRMQSQFPQFGIKAVESSPVKDIYQVELATGELLYATADAKHIFSGDLLQVGNGGILNISEKWRSDKRITALQGLDNKDLVVYPAVGKEKGEVIVFTDTSCGYCRKFHTEIPKLNADGVTVKYAAWPRYGLQSEAGKTMLKIWCSNDRESAMDQAKTSRKVTAETGESCNDQVIQDQIALGQIMGVRGTPAVFSTDGRQLGGYLPADRLEMQLGIK